LSLAVTGVYFAWKAEQARRRAMEELARRNGLHFDPDDDADHDDRYAQFGCRFGFGQVMRLSGACPTWAHMGSQRSESLRSNPAWRIRCEIAVRRCP
jgi:hypothetical protein